MFPRTWRIVRYREHEPAWGENNRSLERLQADRIDLLQQHAVGDLDELGLATRPGGALEAAIRALEAGLVGVVGITGHGCEAPATHLEALVEEVRRQDTGLMTIKTVSRRNWPDGADHSYSTWYEPYDAQVRVTAAVSWVLSHDELTGIPTAGDGGTARHAAEGRAGSDPTGRDRAAAPQRRSLRVTVPRHAGLRREHRGLYAHRHM